MALTRWTFVGKVMSLLLNMLSRLVITFLPRSKCLLISWLQSPSAVILEPPKIKSDTVSPSTCHEVMGPDAMIFVFWMLSFKPTFSLSSFTFIKRLFSPLHFLRSVKLYSLSILTDLTYHFEGDTFQPITGRFSSILFHVLQGLIEFIPILSSFCLPLFIFHFMHFVFYRIFMTILMKAWKSHPGAGIQTSFWTMLLLCSLECINIVHGDLAVSRHIFRKMFRGKIKIS